MKRLELIMIILAVLGLIMILIPITGGTLLLILTLTVLSILYFLFGFAIFNNIKLKEIFKKESYKTIKPTRLIGTIGLGFSLSILCIGIMFTMNHWPGGKMNIIVGLIPLLIILIVSAIRFLMTKSKTYISLFLRIILFGAFGLFLLFASEYWIINIKYRNNPEYLELLKESYKYPDNLELKQKLEEERLKMELGGYYKENQN